MSCWYHLYSALVCALTNGISSVLVNKWLLFRYIAAIFDSSYDPGFGGAVGYMDGILDSSCLAASVSDDDIAIYSQ